MRHATPQIARSPLLRLATLLQLAVALASCQSYDRPDDRLSADERRSIVQEVSAAVRAFHEADTARNAEGVIALLWPDYSMLADGKRMTYDEVEASSHSFMAGLRLFHTVWTDLAVTPLGPHAAVSSFAFRDSIMTISGELIRHQGTTTFVWLRRGAEWRVIYTDANHRPIAD